VPSQDRLFRLTLLAETPPRLAALSAGLATAQLHTANPMSGPQTMCLRIFVRALTSGATAWWP